MAVDQSGASGDSSALPSLLESALPGILARAKVVVSPYPFATSDDDSLRITVVNSLPGVVVEVHGRAVTRAGEAKPFRFLMPSTSDRMPATADFPLAGGFVSNLSAFASGATPAIGQTFVIVQIISGASAAAFVLGTLLSSYITTTQPIGWPGTPIQSSIEGGGYTRFVHGTNPGPGVGIVETVPAGARWEVLTMGAQLATSAAPGNRRVRFGLQASGVNLIDLYGPAIVGPSASFGIGFAQGLPLEQSTSPLSSYAGLPVGLQLSAGAQFGLSCDVMDPADDWGAPAYYVREWLEAQ